MGTALALFESTQRDTWWDYSKKWNLHFLLVEFARSVLGLQDANSTEFEPTTKNPCVIFMPEGSKTHMGGTMRLGSRRTYFQVLDCKSAKLYGNKGFVDERHRHRYEVNPEMVGRLEKAGLCFTGKDITGRRMEVGHTRFHVSNEAKKYFGVWRARSLTTLYEASLFSFFTSLHALSLPKLCLD